MRLVTIQYLRALAACAVFLSHFSENFDRAVSLGSAGVDLFFVISGFVMFLVTDRARTSPAEFMRSRILRIVPMYWFTTLVLFICAYLKPSLFPLDYPEVQHVLMSLFFIPHIAPAGSTYPFVSQGWTLNYEMFFYLVVAATIAFWRNARVLAPAIFISALAVAGAIWAPTNIGLATYTSPLMLEFVTGLLIGKIYVSGSLPSPKICIALVIGAIGFMVAVYLMGLHGGEATQVICFGAPSALIVAGALGLEKYSPRIKWLLLVGDASYSIYLTHFFALLFSNLLMDKLGLAHGKVAFWVAVCAALFGGIAAYKFVEMPMTQFLQGWLKKRPAVA